MFAELINSTIATLAQSVTPGDERHALLIHRLEAVREERCSDAQRCRSCPLHPDGGRALRVAGAGQDHPKSDRIITVEPVLGALAATI
jgi:hypothetical protein